MKQSCYVVDSKETIFETQTDRVKTLEKVPGNVNYTVLECHREPWSVAFNCEHKV